MSNRPDGGPEADAHIEEAPDGAMSRLVFHDFQRCVGRDLISHLNDQYAFDKLCTIDEHVTGFGHSKLTVNDLPFDLLTKSNFIHDSMGVTNWKSLLTNVQTAAFFQHPIDVLHRQWKSICDLTDLEVAKAAGELPELRYIARRGFVHYLTSDHPLAISLSWNPCARHLAYDDGELRRKMQTGFAGDSQFEQHIRELAFANLKDIDFVGLMDDYRTSCLAMNAFFCHSPMSAVQVPAQAARENYSLEVHRAVSRSCAIDQELYTRASQRYKKQIADLRKLWGKDLESAARARYQQSFGELPTWKLIGMGDALQGSGWHCREVNPPRISRWIGPEPKAFLDVVFDKSKSISISLRISNCLQHDQVAKLTLTVDGVAVNLQCPISTATGIYLGGVIEASNLDQTTSLLKMEIDCHATFRSPSAQDSRQLGVEFTEIELSQIDSPESSSLPAWIADKLPTHLLQRWTQWFNPSKRAA